MHGGSPFADGDMTGVESLMEEWEVDLEVMKGSVREHVRTALLRT